MQEIYPKETIEQKETDFNNWEKEYEQKKEIKRRNINSLLPPITEKLDAVFNPAQFGVTYPESWEEESALDEDKRKQENDLYCEVINGLESDLEKLGMELTYSAKIVVREIAMNLVLLERIKTQFICRGLLRHKQELKKSYVSENKSSKSLSYENFFTNEEEIHPLFDRLVPKLQKQINDGLKSLALLPVQQIERQKLVIVKKLRQRYETLYGEVSVEAREEKIV